MIVDNIIQERKGVIRALKAVTYEGGEFKDPDGNSVTPVGSQGDAAGFRYNIDLSATTAGDPGQGKLRFNNAILASVTAIYVDNLNVGGADVSAYVDAMANSQLVIKANDNLDTSFAVFNVSNVVNSTGYRTLTVTFVAGNAFAPNEACVIAMAPKGDSGANGTNGTNGTDGTDGTNGTNAYHYPAWASDTSGTGFTLVYDNTLAFQADIYSTSALTPTAVDYTGLWYKRIAADGAAGARGDNAGFRQNFATSTSMGVNPGVGVVRFNNATPASITAITMSTQTVGGSDITAIIDTVVANDLIRYKSNNANDASHIVFKIVSKTNGTGYRQFAVSFVSGTLPDNAEPLTLDFIFGGVRLDQNGDLIDSSNTVISGIDYGARSTLPAAASNQREFFLATDYGTNGLLYFVPNGGSAWVLPYEQPIYDGLVEKSIIQPNSGVTWTASNNGGNLRLTANTAHGLTTSPAVGASLYVTGGTGWTVGTLIPITAVTSTTVIDTSVPWTSQANPTIAVANTECELYSVALPPLNANSTVIIELCNVFTGSTNAKRSFVYLDTTPLWNINNATASAVLLNTELKFRNRNATNSQKTFSASANGSGLGVMTVGQVSAAVETNVSKNIRFTVQPGVVNEVCGVDSVRVAVRG